MSFEVSECKPLLRGGPLSGPVSVDYYTVDGTADAPADYTETKGTLVFGDGRSLHSLTSELNLRTFGNKSLTSELNLSTVGTHPRVMLGYLGDTVSLS